MGLRWGDGIRVDLSLNSEAEPSFDQERMRQAVYNVFQNGCQAMAEVPAPEGDGCHVLSISSRVRNGRLEVLFEDTGPGVPDDQRGNIFEPLVSTKTYGVGLGLPLVAKVMEQHGGGVEARGNEGNGATFVLWLPLTRGGK